MYPKETITGQEVKKGIKQAYRVVTFKGTGREFAEYIKECKGVFTNEN